MIWEGWAKRRSAPKLKLDKDERGSSTPPSPQQHFKLERQGSKTTAEHQEQHLRIKYGQGSTPPSLQQHLELEHQVTKTTSDPHVQHLRIKKMVLYAKVSFSWQTFNERNGSQLGYTSLNKMRVG